MRAGRGQRGRAKRSLNAQARRSTPPNSPSAWSFLAHKPANALPRCMQSHSGRGRGRERVWKSWLAARTSSPLPRQTPPRSSACARTSAKQQPAQQPARLSDNLALAFDRFFRARAQLRTRARACSNCSAAGPAGLCRLAERGPCMYAWITKIFGAEAGPGVCAAARAVHSQHTPAGACNAHRLEAWNVPSRCHMFAPERACAKIREGAKGVELRAEALSADRCAALGRPQSAASTSPIGLPTRRPGRTVSSEC